MEIIETARAPSLFSGSCAAELLYQIATLSPSPPPPQYTPDIPIVAQQPPNKICCLRFHSAARFTG